MNRADVRESIKMQLAVLDLSLADKFSNTYLNKMIEREHRDVVIKTRALRKGSSTTISATNVSDMTTEQQEVLKTELGDDILLVGFDSYIDLSELTDFYQLITIRKDGEKLEYLKYQNIYNISTVDDYTSDTKYYIAGKHIFFFNGSDIDVTIYYYAKPATIENDSQELELDEAFEDAIIYGVLKRLAISTRGITYEVVAYEYKVALQNAKDYYRSKYHSGFGQVIPRDY